MCTLCACLTKLLLKCSCSCTVIFVVLYNEESCAILHYKYVTLTSQCSCYEAWSVHVKRNYKWVTEQRYYILPVLVHNSRVHLSRESSLGDFKMIVQFFSCAEKTHTRTQRSESRRMPWPIRNLAATSCRWFGDAALAVLHKNDYKKNSPHPPITPRIVKRKNI